MKLGHTKSAESPIRRFSVAEQVHLLSQLRVIELMGTRSLPTSGLCQPRSSPEPISSYRSTIPLQVQSHGTSTALGILPLLWWSQRSPATPYLGATLDRIPSSSRCTCSLRELSSLRRSSVAASPARE